MTALFVTSTGTGIGKTFLTVELTRALRDAGRKVQALKPIVSGFDPQHIAASDTGRLLEALGRSCTPDAVDAVSPWRFTAPVSPDLAAAREGSEIDCSAVVAYCRNVIEQTAKAGGVTLIEGVGGVMVPLDNRHTVLDWIAALKVPALLVAGSYLGTLSHTLTAAGMLDVRGCTLAGIVVNESEHSPVPLEETASTLARFVPAVPIVVLPRGGGPEARKPLLALADRTLRPPL